MKAIVYQKEGSADGILQLADVARPEMRPRDLLVAVKGISINPVDYKVPLIKKPGAGPNIYGFDAAGVVVEKGTAVTGYNVGDEVYYAGDWTRAGSYAELQAVDERIVGRKPKSLDFIDAASVPLTAITAWETLFDSFHLKEGGGEGESLLVVGGAGGVGSIMIQLAKQLTKLTVIATASRPETQDWVRKMGADRVVDHRGDLVAQVRELGLKPRYVAALVGAEQHWKAMLEIVQARGYVGVVDVAGDLDLTPAKFKSVTVSCEIMFARSEFDLPDIEAQRDLLNRVSALIDEGKVQSTVTERAAVLDAATLTAAQTLQQGGRLIGKQVLPGLSQ